MHGASDILSEFDRNRRVVHMQTDGLTQADSLLQPPFRANCLNWVVGHLVVHRDKVLRELGGDPVMTKAETDRYENESDPILADGPDVIDLARLLQMLDESQRRLADVLPGVDLGAEITIGERVVPLWKRVDFLYFHDTYHVGQTELLRQLAGTDDKVI